MSLDILVYGFEKQIIIFQKFDISDSLKAKKLGFFPPKNAEFWNIFVSKSQNCLNFVSKPPQLS